MSESAPAIDENSTDWMEEAKCREMNPDVFFPPNGVGLEMAKQVCASCVVQPECLEYALKNRIDHGVWGGESERERRRISRRRRLGR